MLDKLFAKNTQNKAMNKKIELESEIIDKLHEYSKKDSDVLYHALKKFTSDSYDFWMDLGYIGIAVTNHENLFHIGDVLIHLYTKDLVPNDILCIRTPEDDGFIIDHAKFKSFTQNGQILIQHFPHPDQIYTISPHLIIGKLIKVITIWDDGWEELFDKMNGGHIKFIAERIEKYIEACTSSEDLLEQSGDNIIPDLEKRLTKLESKIGTES